MGRKDLLHHGRGVPYRPAQVGDYRGRGDGDLTHRTGTRRRRTTHKGVDRLVCEVLYCRQDRATGVDEPVDDGVEYGCRCAARERGAIVPTLLE